MLALVARDRRKRNDNELVEIRLGAEKTASASNGKAAIEKEAKEQKQDKAQSIDQERSPREQKGENRELKSRQESRSIGGDLTTDSSFLFGENSLDERLVELFFARKSGETGEFTSQHSEWIRLE